MNDVVCGPRANVTAHKYFNGESWLHIIDTKFVEENHCTDPCSLINIPSIFRQKNDLVLLNINQTVMHIDRRVPKTFVKEEHHLHKELQMFNIAFSLLPFILIQGFIAALFGRRDPSEIRDLIFIRLFSDFAKKGWYPRKQWICQVHKWSIGLPAFAHYVLACTIVILCPILFNTTIISSELRFRLTAPDAEPMTAIGQWGPWAIAAQAIFAALLAHYGNQIWRYRRSIAKSTSGRDTEEGCLNQDLTPDCEPLHHGNDHPQDSQRQGHQPFQQDQDNHSDTTPPSRNGPEGYFPSDQAQSSDPSLLSHQPASPTESTTALVYKIHRKPLPPKPKVRDIRGKLHEIYNMASYPLDHKDRSIIKGFQDFRKWCKDPDGEGKLVKRTYNEEEEGEEQKKTGFQEGD